jgi:hypothetical protein
MQHGDEVFLSQRPPVGLWGIVFRSLQTKRSYAMAGAPD